MQCINNRLADEQCASGERQQSGIRQGCTLSPHLLILSMTVMFHDIHKQERIKQKQCFEGWVSGEVLYADDTNCVSKTAPVMNRLVNEIEKEGATYGLKLSYKKCEYLCFGNEGVITFVNGITVLYKTKWNTCELSRTMKQTRPGNC